MADKHLSAADLRGKIIDAHSHLGIDLQAFSRQEYPSAQSLEGLYYRQKALGVDVNVVFPYGGDLFFDPSGFRDGVKRPAVDPVSPVPYGVENESVMREIFLYNPEHRRRFLPFVCADPGRMAEQQVACLNELEREYPIYGIKISPVSCQSNIARLLDEGRPILDFARKRNLPFLFHTTVADNEQYSQARDCFDVIDANRDLRFCLAHCIGFHRESLQRADGMENVWVDTSALKIQVQCARENNGIVAPEGLRIEADYSDHIAVMRALVDAFPRTMIWGTDSPCYVYICRRKQGEGAFVDFRLKARYEDEKAALDALSQENRMRVANQNTIDFVFGKEKST
jgi:predicted TIM-barrel fold metal-dependent hydrolase